MTSPLSIYPFDSQRLIGTISEVGPTYAKVNLPDAAAREGKLLHGHHFGTGEVGQFVAIECGDTATFGRIISIKLPERERLSVEHELGTAQKSHPIGTIQLLTTVALKDGNVAGGIAQYPRLGSRVFAAHPLLVKWLAEATQRAEDGTECLSLGSGVLSCNSGYDAFYHPGEAFRAALCRAWSYRRWKELDLGPFDRTSRNSSGKTDSFRRYWRVSHAEQPRPACACRARPESDTVIRRGRCTVQGVDGS